MEINLDLGVVNKLLGNTPNVSAKDAVIDLLGRACWEWDDGYYKCVLTNEQFNFKVVEKED